VLLGHRAGLRPGLRASGQGADMERVLRFVSQSFERLGRERGFYSDALMEEVARRGSLHGIPGVPDDARAVFKTPTRSTGAGTCGTRRRSSSTPTTACPRPSTCHGRGEGDVAEAYLLAWREGCLGITVFRDGCKGEQVLNVGVGGDTLVQRPPSTSAWSSPGPTASPARPIAWRRRSAPRSSRSTRHPGGDPFEVFVQVGKAGSDTMAGGRGAWGRLISLVLRLPSPLSAAAPAGGSHQPALAHRGRPAHRASAPPRCSRCPTPLARNPRASTSASSAVRCPRPRRTTGGDAAEGGGSLQGVRAGDLRVRGRLQEVPVLRLQRVLRGAYVQRG
jgi:hypothetical protein